MSSSGELDQSNINVDLLLAIMDEALPDMSRYQSRPTKRSGRRTKAQIEALKDTIYEVVEAGRPMTVRQVFYQLVSRGVIEKAESEYKNTVCRLLTDMRLDGSLPFDWIADHTRWMRKPETHSSLESMLHHQSVAYRRALWDEQDAHVEIWLEKDALAGVLYDVTEEFDVPLMVTRGYPSLSFLAGAANELDYLEKPAHLYYFGDHDPSGVDIPRHVEERLNQLTALSVFEFEVVAVLPWQVEEWSLPTRPTKRSDTRAKNFQGESVEVDAIPPDQLRQLARECIERHVNEDVLERIRETEEMERETLARVLQGLGEQATT